jgi:hypothetical protein
MDTKFKPPFVTDFTKFPASSITTKLTSFFSYTSSPFAYTIFAKDKPDQVLYSSAPSKTFFSDFLIFDTGVFDLNY